MKTLQNSIFLFLFYSISAFSQESDFQTWHSLSYSFDFNIIKLPSQLDSKIKRKGSLTFNHSYRFRENSSLLSKQFSDLRLKLKLNKRLSFAVGYRYSTIFTTPLESSILLFYPYVYNKNRYYSDMIIRKKLRKRYVLNLRTRWLYQGNTFDYNSVIREKLSVSYNIRKTKLQPESSIEFFYKLNESIEKLRYTLVISYPATNNIDIDLAYRIQQEIYVQNPQTLFIFAYKISYKL